MGCKPWTGREARSHNGKELLWSAVVESVNCKDFRVTSFAQFLTVCRSVKTSGSVPQLL